MADTEIEDLFDEDDPLEDLYSDEEPEAKEEVPVLLPGETLQQSLLRRFPYLQEVNYRLLTTEGEVAQYIATIPSDVPVTIDLETSGLNHETDVIVGVALTFVEREGVYIPIAHDIGVNVPWAPVRDLLNKLFEKRIARFYNAKFDIAFLAAAGVLIPLWEDIMIAVFMLDPDSRSKSLKSATRKWLNIPQMEIADLFPELAGKRKRIQFRTIDPVSATLYACGDVDFTTRLGVFTMPVRKEQSFIWNLENSLVDVIRHMESNRFRLDVEYLKRVKTEIEWRIERIRKAIYQQVGGEIDLNSPRKLGQKLFVEMAIPNPHRTEKSNQIATGEAILKKLKDSHPVLGDILTYRGLMKCKSTYIDNLIVGVDANGEGRFCFRQCAAPTGRMASDKGGDGSGYVPLNVQSIPAPGKAKKKVDAWDLGARDWNDPTLCVFAEPVTFGALTPSWWCRRKDCATCKAQGKWVEGMEYWESPNIREAFTGRPGTKIVAIDYAAIEVRIAGNLAKEQVLIESFAQPKPDPHSAIARKMYKKQEITKAERNNGKTTLFTLLFGGSGHALSRNSDGQLTVKQGEALIEDFFAGLPQLHRWIEDTHAFARKNHFIHTFFQRKRRLDMYKDPSWKMQSFGDRSSVSTKVQGTAADTMKIALVLLWKAIRKHEWVGKVRPLLTVHDECVFEIPTNMLMEVIPVLVKAMAFPVPSWPIPLVCDVEIGDNWGSGVEHRLENGQLVLHDTLKTASGSPAPTPVVLEPSPPPPPRASACLIKYNALVNAPALTKFKELLGKCAGTTEVMLRIPVFETDLMLSEKVDVAELLSKCKAEGLILSVESVH